MKLYKNSPQYGQTRYYMVYKYNSLQRYTVESVNNIVVHNIIILLI